MIVIYTPLGPIVERSPGPESQQHNTPRAESQNLPDVINLEGPNPGHSDAEIGVEDGLSDSNPNELPENEEFVHISDLQRFAFALQEAQRRAIRLENEKVKAKRKSLKMYLGNSEKTIAQHEKAHQVLVLQGFHNIFSFISLKERERLAGGRSLEGNEPPSCPSSGAVEESVGLDVDTLSTIDEPCCSSPGGGTGGSLWDANTKASNLIGSSCCLLLGGGDAGSADVNKMGGAVQVQ